MKHILSIALIIFCFCSCKPGKASIEGRWIVTSYPSGLGDLRYDKPMSIEFTKDNKVTFSGYGRDNKGSYELSGNSLTLWGVHMQDDPDTLTIREISKDSMLWSGYLSKAITLKRVSKLN